MKNTRQVSAWMISSDKPIEQALREAGESGYDGMEPAFGEGELSPGITEGRCRQIRKAARDLGVSIESLATGVYWRQSLSDTRTSVREKAIAFTMEYLQVAKWLGVKVVLIVPGAVDVPFEPDARVVPYAHAWKLATDSIRRCLPVAATLGVTMAMENVWNFFLIDPIAMKTFIDQFHSPRVRAYFDVGNCVINGYPEHWIEILGKRINAVHVKGFKRQDGAGGLSGFTNDLTDGDINWQAVVKALKKIKFAGPITAELPPADTRAARRTAKTMMKIFAD
ncbi:MAG: sugar phosphate isomerase/epimerase [Planctomycetes bacterium]|nr:sugar phosphate isomerase/epimerase [Planctomycetota bacterium]